MTDAPQPRQGTRRDRGVRALRTGAGVLALVCVLAGVGCAEARPIDDARPRVEQFLVDEPYPVVNIVLSQDSLGVAQSTEGLTRTWQLFPDRTGQDPIEFRIAAMAAADFPVADTFARAESLVADCDADTYRVVAEAVSGAAVLTHLSCGDEPAGTFLNKTELRPLLGGWTTENLTVIWGELRELAPRGQVRSVLLARDGASVELMPEPGVNAGCRLGFTRRFENPADTLSTCWEASEPWSTIDLNMVTAERLGAAIERAGKELNLPDSAMATSVTVLSGDGGRPQVTVMGEQRSVTVPIR